MSRGMRKDPGDFPKRLKLFGVLFAGLIVLGSGLTSVIKSYSFRDSLTYTLETLAFMFHDEVGAAKFLEIFLAIFGVFLIWWILWSLFDTIFDKSFLDYMYRINMLKRLKKMKNHYIIAGGGRVGDEIAHNLSGQKKKYIIIDKDKEKVSELRKEGLKAIEGDITEEKVLLRAGIKAANTIFITSPETETNLLVIMLAKELNKDISIYARSDRPEYNSLLEKAGAKKVVVPEISAANEMINKIKQE